MLYSPLMSSNGCSFCRVVISILHVGVFHYLHFFRIFIICTFCLQSLFIICFFIIFFLVSVFLLLYIFIRYVEHMNNMRKCIPTISHFATPSIHIAYEMVACRIHASSILFFSFDILMVACVFVFLLCPAFTRIECVCVCMLLVWTPSTVCTKRICHFIGSVYLSFYLFIFVCFPLAINSIPNRYSSLLFFCPVYSYSLCLLWPEALWP